MSSNQNLPLATPDFDDIRIKLKEFLSTQDELKDYNFDGSVLSAVLDVLSYNSHMNAFYLNMVGNEAFLSTAVRRSSVVANAKDLGYVPTSAKSARTSLYLEYDAVGAPQPSITIPEGTAFGASTNGAAYIFSTVDSHLAIWNNTINKYVADDIPVFEGRRFEHTFTVVSTTQFTQPDTVYDVTNVGVSVPNLNADSSTMKVYVNDPSISSDFILFSQYVGDLGIDSRSNVYFVGEDDLGRVNIKFGDGIIGKRPGVGSKIKVVYLVSSGPDANGVAIFSQTTAVPGAALTKATPKYPAAGGSTPESVESIKFNAPLAFESQERGVVDGDFRFLTKQVYPNAKAVISWGGQDNDPPVFGKVFISVLPNQGVIITQGEKDAIISHLTSKSVLTITPVIVDPDFIFVDTTTKVKYSSSQSTAIGGQLEGIVANRIREYSDVVLADFKKDLEFSRFVAYIDESDPGIISNTSSVSLAKRFYVTHGIQQQATIKFSNPITNGSVSSSRFTYGGFANCRFGSFGPGGLAILAEQGGSTLTIVSNVGSINYETGTVTVNPTVIDSSDPLFFDSLVQKFFIRFTAKPRDPNITTSKNQIITIENITVTSEKVQNDSR